LHDIVPINRNAINHDQFNFGVGWRNRLNHITAPRGRLP
jgi:hypothetical protein